jgi:hypothetical protein
VNQRPNKHALPALTFQTGKTFIMGIERHKFQFFIISQTQGFSNPFEVEGAFLHIFY